MRRLPFLHRRLAVVLLVGLGCAATASAATRPASDGKIGAEVPAKVRARRTLVVATTATNPPIEFTLPAGRAVLGMDPDLTLALASVLRLHVRFVDVRFDAIVQGVAAGAYDLGVSSITATPARQKVVDFVTYFSAGTSFYVKAGGGPRIRTLADLCGRTVAVVAGTTQAADAEAQNAACVRSGKRAVTVAIFPDENSTLIALESSSTAVGMADTPVATYLVGQSHGQLRLSGRPYGVAPYGIAVPKSSGMARPVLDALRKLIRDGTYRAILARWGIAGGAIANPRILGASGPRR